MAALIMHKRVNSTSLIPFESCFTLGGIDLHYAGWTNSPPAWTSVKVSREGQVSVIFNNRWDFPLSKMIQEISFSSQNNSFVVSDGGLGRNDKS